MHKYLHSNTTSPDTLKGLYPRRRDTLTAVATMQRTGESTRIHNALLIACATCPKDVERAGAYYNLPG